MLKTIFLVICLGRFAPGRADEELLGKGMWSLISVIECSDGLIKETLKLDVTKRKLNRTHEGLSAHITITEEINDSYRIYIEMCKYVDGGCKPYTVISENLVKLSDKYAKEHVMSGLKLTNINATYFPIPTGEYELEDYMPNYCDMLTVCPFGRYELLVYLIFDKERIACLKLLIEFKKCRNDENCCDDELVAL